jgi:DNA-binding MarR family transcriptional regulator
MKAKASFGVDKLSTVSYSWLTMKHSSLPTYQAVVLQSRAHRAIKESLTRLLRNHGITMMQWSIIGLIADAGKGGMRISDLAQKLDTSLAFITTSVNVLEAKSLVYRVGHARDNRSKLVHLNPDFAPRVATIEAEVSKKQMAEVYHAISPTDLTIYFNVLSALAKKA